MIKNELKAIKDTHSELRRQVTAAVRTALLEYCSKSSPFTFDDIFRELAEVSDYLREKFLRSLISREIQNLSRQHRIKRNRTFGCGKQWLVVSGR